jgi:hypothetical protein
VDASSQIETAARSEIEVAFDGAGHNGRPRLCAQRFLERPKGIFFGAGNDEQETVDVEAELVQAMTVRLSEMRQGALRSHEYGWAGMHFETQSRKSEEETESGGPVLVYGRSQFVQHPTGETGTRQMTGR